MTIEDSLRLLEVAKATGSSRELVTASPERLCDDLINHLLHTRRRLASLTSLLNQRREALDGGSPSSYKLSPPTIPSMASLLPTSREIAPATPLPGYGSHFGTSTAYVVMEQLDDIRHTLLQRQHEELMATLLEGYERLSRWKKASRFMPLSPLLPSSFLRNRVNFEEDPLCPPENITSISSGPQEQAPPFEERTLLAAPNAATPGQPGRGERPKAQEVTSDHGFQRTSEATNEELWELQKRQNALWYVLQPEESDTEEEPRKEGKKKRQRSIKKDASAAKNKKLCRKRSNTT